MDSVEPGERRPLLGVEAAPERRLPDERQALVSGFVLAQLREQDIEGLLAAACRLCRQAVPISSFTVLEHSLRSGSDVIRINVECAPEPDSAADASADGGGAPVGNLSIPGDCRPYGVLRVGLPGGCALAASDMAFLAVVAELLGAAIARLGQDETQRQAHVAEDAPAAAQRELLAKLQARLRDDLQVLHGFAQLRTRRAHNSHLDAEFGAINRRLVSLAALYLHLAEEENSPPRAGLDQQVEFSDYLRNLCALIEAAQGLAARGIKLDADLCPLPMSLEAAAGLGIAVNELVAAAADHAFGGGGGRILVRLRPADNGHGRATLLVEDDGAEDAPDEDDGVLYLRGLVARAGARIERQGGGTRWRIDLH